MKSTHRLSAVIALTGMLSGVWIPASAEPIDFKGETGQEPSYDELENLICQTYEMYLGRDTDNDGDPDCSDPDDDGDLVTDEFEDRYIGGNARIVRDTDGDGIPDGLDILPKVHKTKKMEFTLHNGLWEDVSADCDDGPGNDYLPDPYIKNLKTHTSTGTHSLPVPPGWSIEYTDGWFTEGPHEDISRATMPDSTTMSAGDALAFAGSQNIDDWMQLDKTLNFINGEYPAFVLSLVMFDNDENNDDPINLLGTSPTGILKIALGTTGGSGMAMYGEGDCAAIVTWSLASSADTSSARFVWKSLLAYAGQLAGVQNTGKGIPGE